MQARWLIVSSVIAGCGGAQVAKDPVVLPSSSAETRPAVVNVPPDDSPKRVAGASSVDLACTKKARELDLGDRASLLVHCPKDCSSASGAVWGTDLYTDDSAVCPALVHAGVIPAAGGTAEISFVSGLKAYVASTRNGVSSKSYGKWRRSFFARSLGPDGLPVGVAPALPAADSAQLDCSHKGGLVGGKDQPSLTIHCPPGCAETQYALWGSNPYTADSHACAAAVHAGIIPPTGGTAVLVGVEGQPSYQGQKRNGLESRPYGKYGTSFRVEAPK